MQSNIESERALHIEHLNEMTISVCDGSCSGPLCTKEHSFFNIVFVAVVGCTETNASDLKSQLDNLSERASIRIVLLLFVHPVVVVAVILLFLLLLLKFHATQAIYLLSPKKILVNMYNHG